MGVSFLVLSVGVENSFRLRARSECVIIEKSVLFVERRRNARKCIPAAPKKDISVWVCLFFGVPSVGVEN